MLWEKNHKKEVFFTEEAADKQLLTAIEKELNAQKYQTFSNLCKQALWQFLYVSSSPELVQSPSTLQKVEHRIYEKLGQHFSELEKKIVSQQVNQANQSNDDNLSQLNDLKNYLIKLSEQLNQMQLNIDGKLIEALAAFQTELPKIEAAINQIEIPIIQSTQETEVTPEKPREVPENVNDESTETDPLLERLGSLLEDF
ncbi:MAG: hypothetical protein AB4080_26505 [Trichodesmium sp.]